MATPDVKEVEPAQGVRTRRVHYIAGFDPRGARFYHRLYREESAKQSRLNGSILEVEPCRRMTAQVSAWSIKGEWKDQSVTTSYEFMRWDDIVRRHWDTSLWGLLQRAVPVYFQYAASGSLSRIRDVSPGAFYSAVFPPAYLLILAAILAGAAVTSAWLTSALTGNELADLGAALGLAFGLGWGGLRLAEHLGVLWLLRSYVFICAWGLRPIPELEERIQAMADRIVQEQEASPVDEVLIIGHSIGSILVIAVAARLLAKPAQEKIPSSITLLTLGQCIPFLSFIPSAGAFRRDLETVGNDARISWTDASSPPDPLCFFRVDPIRVSGLTSRFRDRPRQVAVRVFKMFSPPAYAQIRRNKLRLHFQYLMASELPSDYDYFLITAGPGKLHLWAA